MLRGGLHAPRQASVSWLLSNAFVPMKHEYFTALGQLPGVDHLTVASSDPTNQSNIYHVSRMQILHQTKSSFTHMHY